MNREGSFSLTVMVIIMALLAIFVGYLLGNWLIQLVTGDSNQVQQVEKKIVEEEIIEDEGNKQSEESSLPKATREETEIEESTSQPSQPVKEQLKGEVYVVQVGAFNNRNNALKLKEELAEKGFQAIITDGIPYKVQLGATNEREDAEATEARLENLGYEAFITH